MVEFSLASVARLCMGIRSLYVDALKNYEAVDEGANSATLLVSNTQSVVGMKGGKLNKDLLSFLRLAKALSLALTYKYIGFDQYKNGYSLHSFVLLSDLKRTRGCNCIHGKSY